MVACHDKNNSTQALQAHIEPQEAANAVQASQQKDISDFMSVVSEGLDSITAMQAVKPQSPRWKGIALGFV